MSDDFFLDAPSEPKTEGDFARRRNPESTYITKSVPYPFSVSSDFGEPGKRVRRVFDEFGAASVEESERYVITENRRTQICMWIVRETGRVKEIRVEKVPQRDNADIEVVLRLTGENCARFVNLVRVAERVDPTAGYERIRIDDSLLDLILADPHAASGLYSYDPGFIRQLIADDSAATDVIAISRRREQVARFRRLLEDDEYFDSEVDTASTRGAEAIWQAFFQGNPWILGVGLSSQLLTSWDEDRLEQVVAGFSAIRPGKRVDALLETSGAVRSLVFAEFKTHRADLLGKEYRGGCWAPSEELASGVAQVHGTVHRAIYDFTDHIKSLAPDGSVIPGQYSYLLRPKSYLLIGRLEELKGQFGGDHQDKIRSFELFRRQVQEPEILTFDELLIRAEWHVNFAAGEQ